MREENSSVVKKSLQDQARSASVEYECIVRPNGAVEYIMDPRYGKCCITVYALTAGLAYIEFRARFNQNCQMPRLALKEHLGISCCLEGDGKIIGEGIEEPIGPGSILYSGNIWGDWPNSTMFAYKENTEYVRNGFCSTEPIVLGEKDLVLLEQTVTREAKIPITCHSDRLERLFRYLYEAPFSSAEAKALFLKGSISCIYAMLLEQTPGLSIVRPYADGEYELDMIKKARDLMMADLTNPPTIAYVAKAVGLNETKLKREFKRVYGEPIYRYFKREKLFKARQMLCATNMTVLDVALGCGYSSQGQFCTAFREMFGDTPLHIRKQYSTVKL